MAVIQNCPKSFTEKQKGIPKGALLVVKDSSDTAKVTKLDMSYCRWTSDMTELFGQKVEVYGKIFVSNTGEKLVNVRLNHEDYYIIPEDWLTFEKKKRKLSEYCHKLVCVESPTSYFTVGKVYLFDKGILSDNSDVKWNVCKSETNGLTYAQNVEDINKYFEVISTVSNLKFIEYVE